VYEVRAVVIANVQIVYLVEYGDDDTVDLLSVDSFIAGA